MEREILRLAAAEPKVPDWLVKPSKASKSPGVPTLFLTDLHYGEVVDPAQVGRVNSYNVESRAAIRADHRRCRGPAEAACG